MPEAERLIAAVTLVVDDYDRAIAYFTGSLGFDLVEDTQLDGDKRWVVVAPGRSGGTNLLLAKAVGAEQSARIGNQTGGRVAFFLRTGEFDRDFALFSAQGVDFIEAPRHEAYGKVAVFRDPWGNRWDLLQPDR